MIQEAVKIASDRLASHGFKQFCKDYKFSYTTSTGRLWWKKSTLHHQAGFKFPNGMTGEEVYHYIMAGSEKLNQGNDNEADITLVIDRRNKRRVVGYTYANSYKQWMYSWVLETTAEKIAGNIIHEWMHKLGFKHAYRFNSTRKHTVPYAVGNYVAGK